MTRVTNGRSSKWTFMCNLAGWCISEESFNPLTPVNALFTLLQQTTIENIVTDVKIAYNEQFLILSQYVKLFSMIIFSLVKRTSKIYKKSVHIHLMHI